MQPCPTGDALRHWLDGAGDPQLIPHIEECPDCQAALDELSADPTVMPQSLAESVHFPPPAGLVARLADTPPLTHSERADPAPLPVVAGFTLKRVIGRGGVGIVYEAVQQSLRRVVALKMLHPGHEVTAAERTRFEREAEAVARLHHPNVVEVYEAGESGGRPYLAMEYAGGPSLADQLVGDPWPARAAAELVATLAGAVEAAHQCGIVHRDLKPGNVLFTPAGVAKVADFGLARLLDAPAGDPTLGGGVFGTPSYAAPEQLGGLGGEPTPAADVYSLGVVLYELLTGRPPFRAARPMETVLQVLHLDPISPARLEPRVPRDLETVCLKCLNKTPARRYASAGLLEADLKRFLDGRSVLARPSPGHERARKWCRRHPGAAAATLGLMALTAGLCVALTWLWRAAESRAALEAHARHQTETRATVEAGALRDATRRNAELRVGHLLDLCEQGEVARGMQGLAEVHDTLPLDAADLRHLVRRNLAAWQHRLALPAHALPHPNVVRHLAFSPDGRVLVTAAQKGVRVWDVASGKLVGEARRHAQPVRGLAISPAGGVGASWAEDAAHVWETVSGRPVGVIQHAAGVTGLALAPGGEFVVTGAADGSLKRTTVPKFDSPDWAIDVGGPVGSVDVSPDGRRVVTGRADGVCQLWDAETGLSVGEPFAAGSQFRSARFDASGLRVAGAAGDSLVHLLDVDGGLRKRYGLNPRLPVRTLSLATQATVLVAGFGGQQANRSGYCLLWDTTTGQRLSTLEFDGPVTALALSPDAERLVAGGGHRRVAVWLGLPDRPTRLNLGNAGQARALALSTDGRVAAIGRDDTSWAKDAPERAAHLWALPPDQRTGLRLPHPTATQLATDWAGRTAVTADRDGHIRAWALPTGQPLGPPVKLANGIDALAVHPTRFQALASAEEAVYPIDLMTGAVGRPLRLEQPLRCIRYAPGGDTVAIGGLGRRVELRSADTLDLVGKPLWLPDPLIEVGFRPDGSRLVTVTNQGEVQDWELATRTASWSWRLNRLATAAAVAPDGQTVAVGGHDRTVRRVRVGTPPGGEPVFVMPDVITRVGWCVDGQSVAVVSMDGTARLLDAATWKPVGPSLPQRVTAILPLPGRPSLLAAGAGPAAIGWAIPPALPETVRDLPDWIRTLNRTGEP